MVDFTRDCASGIRGNRYLLPFCESRVLCGNDMVMIKKDQEKGNNQSQQEPLIGARPYIFQEVPRVPFENPYNNHSQRGPLIGAQPHISLTNYRIPTIQQPASGRKSEISSGFKNS